MPNDIPMKPAYTYRAYITEVIDPTTFLADIDLGFGIWKHDFLLHLNGVTTKTLARGELDKDAEMSALSGFIALTSGEEVIVEIVKKPCRWAANVFVLEDDGNIIDVADYLLASCWLEARQA